MKKYPVFLFISIMFGGFFLNTANAELITNGGFESGDLSSWSCIGADSCIADSTSPYEGSYSMRGYDNDGYATLSQSILTTVGASYDFIFFSKVYDQLAGNELGYSFSGYSNAVFVSPTIGWTQTVDNFVAAANNTLIEFYFSTDPGTGTWGIDNVSVEPSTAVPEPATLLMLSFGLVGLSRARRKLKK